MLNAVSDQRSIGSVLLGIAASAFLFQSDSAWAREHEVQTRSLVITTYGLDLNSVEGHRELDRRIGRAARQVCAVTGERLAPGVARCVSEARRTAYRIPLCDDDRRRRDLGAVRAKQDEGVR